MRLSGERWEIRVGSNLELLPEIPERSVQVCCTSPPYFALRKYLPKDHPDAAHEIGTEDTPEAYIERLVRVFRGVRRALRDDGVCWVNLGDSYANDTKWGGGTSGKHVKSLHGSTGIGRQKTSSGLASSNLLNIPHRVAEALRADGWIWRQTIIWSKRSPMPESTKGPAWVRCQKKVKSKWDAEHPHPSQRDESGRSTFGEHSGYESRKAEWEDCPGCPRCEKHHGYVLRKGSGRCTTSHEYLFLMTKTNSYFWDSEASKEQGSGLSGGACFGKTGGSGSRRMKQGENEKIRAGTRNPRSVWTLSSEPLKAKHYAAWPTELVRRCLVATLSPGGCCAACGTSLAPVVEHEDGHDGSRYGERALAASGGALTGGTARSTLGSPHGKLVGQSSVTDYWPQCACGVPDRALPLVLDPFCGSARTGRVAINMGGRFLGLELNEQFATEIAAQEIVNPWRPQVGKSAKKSRPVSKAQRELF